MELHGSKRRIEQFLISERRGKNLIGEQQCISTKNLIDEQQCISTSALITRQQFPILELPVHLIYDILSRLPLKSIFCCRCVCKMLLKLLKDSYFTQLHCSRAATSTTNLILQTNVGQWGALHFFTFDHSEARFSSCSSDDQNIHCYFGRGLHFLTMENAELSFLSQRLDLIGSCNGLLCLHFGSPSKPYYAICNPVCCECVKLPHLVVSAPFYTYANHSGFGYCPKTKQYKVISFMYLTSVDPVTSVESRRMVADVHTLGSDLWRRIENVPWPKRKSFDPLLNGTLHWIVNSYKPCELITSFDLATETFKFVPPPAHFSLHYLNKISWINIGVLNDCLCICYIYEDAEFEVWLMREYGVKESWTRHFSIDMKFYCKLQVEDLHRPIRFLSNGDMWFISSSESLVAFSPAKRTFRELRTMGSWKTEVTAHNLSFVSLKDVVGAKSPKVKNLKFGRQRFIFVT